MSEYDGKIQLGMDVSPEDAIKSFRRLQSEAQKSLNKLSTDNLTKSEEKSLTTLSKIVSRGEAAAKTVEKLSQPIETKEYTKLSQEYDKLSAKLETLAQRRDQLVHKGAKDTDPAVHALDEKLVSIRSRLYDIDTELDKMVAEGKQFTINEAGLENAKNSLVDINNQLLLQNETSTDIQSRHSAEADALAQQVAKFAEIRLNAGEVNSEIADTLTELTEVNDELASVRDRMAELEDAGRGLGYEEYDNLLAVETELVERQETLNEEVSEYRDRMTSVEEPMSRWERFKETLSGIWQALKINDGSFSKLAKTVGQIATKFILAASGADKLKSALQGVTQKATQSSFNFKKLFNTLLKYGIGVRSIFVLYRKIRSAITENIKYYALMNNGMNQTNKAISAMQSSLNALKGALAGAFIPIITHVSPMLTSFIDKIAAVVTAIGMFIAKLTGAKTYLKAVKKDTNYAAGLSGGGSGKSAQEKYDEAVAKAQEKYEKDLAKAQEKRAKQAAKAEEKEAKAAAKLAKEQEKANNQLASFDDLNVLGIESAEDMTDAYEDMLDEIADPELEMPNMEDFLGGGGGTEDPFGFEEIPLDNWEWNWDDLLKKARELGEKLAEFLNDIFKDEDLAKRIGNTIGNLINLAINFAYGFVSTFDFHQFGKWLGTLLQEAVETIDWGLLGDTIGKGLNGIADTIIGFFEGYDVGTLGRSISEMLNHAIHEIDAGKIGQATLSLLQAPLLELREVLTETHWRELGAKVSVWFTKVFSSEGLKGESLGTTIGKTIGAAVNAGIDFLLGLDIAQAITDIAMFFTDIFVGAAKEIDWPNFFELIEHALLGFTEGLGNIASIWGGMIVVSLEEAINDKLHIEVFKQEDIDRQKKEIELLREGLITTGDIAEGTADQIATMYNNIGDGMQYSFDQLVRFQSGAGLTNEQIEKMISSMEEYARVNGETFDAAALGLEGYTGNWQTYRDTVLGIVDETNEKISSTDGVVKNLSDTTDLLKEKTKNVGSTIKEEADTTAEKLDHTAAIGKDHLGVLDAAIDTSDTNVNEYSDSAVEALSKVDAKTGEVSINFEQMTELVQLQLESLTTMIDTWYQEMVLKYFSYDAWLLMLQEGPLLALTDFFTTLFSTEFDTQMQAWWDTHLLPWFADTKWQTAIYTPWFTFLKTKWKNLLKWWDDEAIKPWWEKHLLVWFKDDKWQTDVYTPWFNYLSTTKWTNLMTWWDTSMKDWWDNKVVPWFKQDKWEKEFDHVYDAAETIGEKIRDKIKELAEETETAVHEACTNMKGWIEEVIEALHEAIALAQQLQAMSKGGGSGSSSSSSSSSGNGGSNSGGGSGGRSFMPMLNIMHFEDNLGMSAFKFPELATGAVIPPNNEFLAILGDQRNGMNIETPLSTMLEAFRSVMDEYMGGSHQSAIMEVDGETFARLMMPHMVDEMHRLGYNTEIIEGI